MPTYVHICTDEKCNHEWEDFYSITKDPPKICPQCNQETAQRVISGGSGKGQMVLTDEEFKAGLKDEVRKIKKDMHSNANTYANFLGEDKYHQIQTQMDRRKKGY